jgi:hypothetical protein
MPEGPSRRLLGIIYGGWTGIMNVRRWTKAVTQ